MHDTTLPLGTYHLLSAATFTSQTWDVTAEEVRIFSATSGAYTPEFLGTMTHDQALEILALGTALRFPTPEFIALVPATIGNALACELHRELGRLQFRNHYSAATEALGRPVSSLAALNAAEAATVRSYAYGQWGLSA